MFPRLVVTELTEALEDTPVVMLHGPRQTGKSTLAQNVGKALGATYLTLDDPVPRSLAQQDPASLLSASKQMLIIDEVQRAPELFLALKSAVDRDRRPGRFLLTGSANVLAIPKIADSLAGRIAIIDLHPLAQAEIEGATGNFVDRLFSGQSIETPPPPTDLLERVVKGGFPEPYSRAKDHRRDAWFADYVRTLLERDVRDLANIEGLAQMPKLLRMLAVKSGTALNVADLAAETRIPNTSLHRYLDLLKALFLTFQTPAWSFDETTKLAKTPKTFLVDAGLSCYLRNLGVESLERDKDQQESILKTFATTEIRKLASVSTSRANLFHLRTVRRLEVDIVLENRAGSVVGVAITSSPHPLPEHLEGLAYLRELAGDRFRGGVLLYCGTAVQAVGDGLRAVPVSALWSNS